MGDSNVFRFVSALRFAEVRHKKRACARGDPLRHDRRARPEAAQCNYFGQQDGSDSRSLFTAFSPLRKLVAHSRSIIPDND